MSGVWGAARKATTIAIIDYKQRLHPQMRAMLEKQAEVVPGAGKVHEFSVGAARQQYATGRSYWNADAPGVHEVIDTSVEGSAGRTPLRIYRLGDDVR